MTPLTPFQTLYTAEDGQQMPLPALLADLYGRLQFPLRPESPYIIGNFVTTLDGVVSLNAPGQSGGKEISGFNQHDRMLMGLLRGVADAVIAGAGTLRDVPRSIWTADYIYPPLADEYHQLRARLGKTEPPLNVIVTARGKLDLTLPVFRSGNVPVLIVTTRQGAQALPAQNMPKWVHVAVAGDSGAIRAEAILESVGRVRPSQVILVEGGPHLMSDFFGERCLDELFLTLAPQVAGRDDSADRPGLVMGKLFAPDDPLWGTLVGVKRAESHLFLRYQFDRANAQK